MSFKDIKCAFCSSNKTKIRAIVPKDKENFLVPELKGINREWVDCQVCNICFSIPRLTYDQLNYMYRNYRAESFRGETPDEYFDRITSYKPEESENFQKLSWIKKYLNPTFEPKTILDIGCGGGVLLHSMGSTFEKSKLYGVEPTPNFAELASRRTNATIINSYYTRETFENITFDLITCCQVLEHIDDLKSFVSDLCSSINNNGYVYIEVPDISDFDSLPISHSRFSEPSHLWYYSKEFLTTYFESNSFSVVKLEIKETIRGRNNLMILLQNVV